MKKTIVFSKEKLVHNFNLFDNNFFVAISKMELINISEEEKKSVNQVNFLNKKLKNKYQNDYEVNPFSLSASFEFSPMILNNETDYQYNKIELSIEDKIDFDVKLEIETVKRIYPVNPYNDFQSHLSKHNNSKIIFSAPFGQGKTTFTQDFFQNRKEYEVFHLFPVNYSIATNTDVFEYIKCEILFQLLDKDVEFEREELSIFLTLPEFAKENIETILIEFARLIPNIGKDVSSILKNLLKLKTKYLKYSRNIQVDDIEVAKKFLETFIEKEGSIYENNYITQIIRQLIEQFYPKEKQTVLVIDDLDRIDPDHIFRILNVFSAHFDTPNHKSHLASNKFGFDKIILICDYKNLQSIFAHKFGNGTSFSGYIDKFHSNDVFYYNNDEAIKYKLSKFENNTDSNFLKIIFRDLRKLKLLSIREAIRIENIDLSVINNFKPIALIENEFDQVEMLYLLNSVFSIESIILKVQQCSDIINEPIVGNYTKYAKDCFIPLVATGASIDKGNSVEYVFNKETYHVTVQRDMSSDLLVSSCIKNINNGLRSIDDVKFTSTDFYMLVLQIIEKYKKYFN